MLLYVQTWLPLLTSTLTAAIFFSVASFIIGGMQIICRRRIEDRRMSRECNERMWNLAYRLAHCGEHRNYQAIEWELQAYGYPQARQLLYHDRVRERLDAICAEAQRSPTEAF